MNEVIEAERLSKMYHIGSTRSGSLRETLTARLNIFSNKDQRETEFWALKDVSFTVREGQVIGIIGKNGAGKSTLLKILSRITEPTEGVVKINGRISSLLEVGTGFHPELTGRENIFMNGAILGMKRTEIKKKFDEIVAFSGIEQFIDTPVKRYSSGMYVRLAFSVAAHLEPEILIVDEVLAVGDAEFQKKCLGKMKDVSVYDGRTVLFVSHNMAAVQNLCNRALLLKNGSIAFEGSVAEAISRYFEGAENTRVENLWNSLEEAPGNDMVKLMRAAAYAEGQPSSPLIKTSDTIILEFDFYQFSIKDGLDITMNIFDESGIHLCHVGTICSELSKPLKEGYYRTRTTLPADILNAKSYFVDMWFGLNRQTVACTFEKILSFTLEDGENSGTRSLKNVPGIIHPILKWKTEKLEQNPLV